MISTLLSKVHVLTTEDVNKEDFLTILRYATGKNNNLKVAFVYDNAPIPKRDALIKESADFAEIKRFNKVRPNPHTEDIQAMSKDCNSSNTDIIVAIGGGSVMDSAKAMAMLATNGGNLEDYLGNTPKRKIEKQGLPLIAVPTTAGTGSEVTSVGVYTAKSGRKFTLGSPLMTAHTAVLCGSFIDSIPLALCAATGIDALDHAFESIWNKNATPVTKHAAEQAAIKVLITLPKLYRALKAKKKNIRKLQTDMLCASCMAGIAFARTGTASGHAISFILSEEWNIPHGAACAFTLPQIFDYACMEKETRQSLARIAAFFYPTVSDENTLIIKLRKKVMKIITECNLPQKFADFSVTLPERDIWKYFERSFSDPKMHNQLPAMTKESLIEILKNKL